MLITKNKKALNKIKLKLIINLKNNLYIYSLFIYN